MGTDLLPASMRVLICFTLFLGIAVAAPSASVEDIGARIFHQTANSIVYKNSGNVEGGQVLKSYAKKALPFAFFRSVTDDASGEDSAEVKTSPFVPAFKYSLPFFKTSDAGSAEKLVQPYTVSGPSIKPFGFKPLFSVDGDEFESMEIDSTVVDTPAVDSVIVKSVDTPAVDSVIVKSASTVDTPAVDNNKVVVESQFGSTVAASPQFYSVASSPLIFPSSFSMPRFYHSSSTFTLPRPVFYSSGHAFPFIQPYQYVVAKAESAESDD